MSDNHGNRKKLSDWLWPLFYVSLLANVIGGWETVSSISSFLSILIERWRDLLREVVELPVNFFLTLFGFSDVVIPQPLPEIMFLASLVYASATKMPIKILFPKNPILKKINSFVFQTAHSLFQVENRFIQKILVITFIYFLLTPALIFLLFFSFSVDFKLFFILLIPFLLIIDFLYNWIV